MHGSSRSPGPFSVVAALSLLFPAMAAAQVDTLAPGDARLAPERIREHTATHRFIQYGDDGAVEVGRLSRSVERVHHTADEPTILISMQFRSPTRSGLDIVYLDANTLSSSVRYLTSPTGLRTMYQMDGRLHVTFSSRDGQRVTADTTVVPRRFGGSTDLVLASLALPAGDTVVLPELSAAAATLSGTLSNSSVAFDGRESLELPGVWRGDVSRFTQIRPDGSRVTYWISRDAPHLIRQDFSTAEGRHFLRWELVEYTGRPVQYGR